MQFFEQKVDLRRRKAMTDFLTEHYRYDATYANKVKMWDLKLTSGQMDNAFEMMASDYNHWDNLSYLIDEFTEEMNGHYTISSAGRSSGYLVLCESQYETTKHKSRCRACGQLNFKSTYLPPEVPTPGSTVMVTVIRQSGVSTLEAYLQQPAIQALSLPDSEKLEFIQQAKRMAPDYMVGNRCGRCGTEGERGLWNLENPIRRLVTQSSRIDQYEEFHPEEWDMDALRRRVRLVQAFDRTCDRIRTEFIYMLDNPGEFYAEDEDEEDDEQVAALPNEQLDVAQATA